MKRIVCNVCNREMTMQTVGVLVVETYMDPPRPYQLWNADIYRCRECTFRVAITGDFGKHFDREAASEVLAALKTRIVTLAVEKGDYDLIKLEKHCQEILDATRNR